MDSNAALARIREVVQELDGETDEFKYGQLGEELCQLVQGLDEWLSRGGFLPQAWERKS